VLQQWVLGVRWIVLEAKKEMALKMVTTLATEGRIPGRNKRFIKNLKPSHIK
jgi:hypothetical protein